MNRKRFIFLCCTLLACAGAYAKAYSSKTLAFDYPDGFSLKKDVNSIGLFITIYSNDSTAIVKYSHTKVSKPITIAPPSLLRTMQSQILRELTELTKDSNVKFGNYQCVRFEDPQEVTLTYIQGAQRIFEEKTTDGNILKGTAFIAVDGKELLQVIILASDENSIKVLNDSLQSIRFGSAASSQPHKK